MIDITAIASGSNGNCYYIGNKEDAILIDAGVTCRQILLRMKNLNLNIEKVKGIFVTHEHIDHIKGLEIISRKFEIPVYITKKTYDHSRLYLREELLRFIDIGKTLKIGNISIMPFSKNHDAVDPCSYTVEYNGKKVSVITDVGCKCNNVSSQIKESDAIFLESNYDEDMLMNGKYPEHLKKRISSDDGHLSNYQAALLVLEHASPKLKFVFLSHFSGNNNDPDLAYNTFTSMLNERKDLKLNVIKTSRHRESQIVKL